MPFPVCPSIELGRWCSYGSQAYLSGSRPSSQGFGRANRRIRSPRIPNGHDGAGVRRHRLLPGEPERIVGFLAEVDREFERRRLKLTRAQAVEPIASVGPAVTGTYQ